MDATTCGMVILFVSVLGCIVAVVIKQFELDEMRRRAQEAERQAKSAKNIELLADENEMLNEQITELEAKNKELDEQVVNQRQNFEVRQKNWAVEMNALHNRFKKKEKELDKLKLTFQGINQSHDDLVNRNRRLEADNKVLAEDLKKKESELSKSLGALLGSDKGNIDDLRLHIDRLTEISAEMARRVDEITGQNGDRGAAK